VLNIRSLGEVPFRSRKLSGRGLRAFYTGLIINLINFPARTYERLIINPKFYKKKFQKEIVRIVERPCIASVLLI